MPFFVIKQKIITSLYACKPSSYTKLDPIIDTINANCNNSNIRKGALCRKLKLFLNKTGSSETTRELLST